MQSKFLVVRKCSVPVLFSILAAGCVNPPQRASGVSPGPIASPSASPEPTFGGPGRGDDDNRGVPTLPQPAPQPSTGAANVKVSYWLNNTDNSNCLTIQVSGATPVSAPCTGGGRTSPQWIENTYPSAGTAAFKATLKVETTDKAQAKTTTATDSLGDAAWRWRCMSKTDPATRQNVYVACYEDGNALNKAFDSSDLFIQIIGPSSLDLGGLQCPKVDDFDLNRCGGK